MPTIFDKPANQGDAHTFVIPRNPGRSPERLDAALDVHLAPRAQGAWTGRRAGTCRPTARCSRATSTASCRPQSDYAEAAERVVFDPLAWYSGSGSNLETNAGSAFKPVITGAQKPEQGLATFRDYLARVSKKEPPV